MSIPQGNFQSLIYFEFDLFYFVEKIEQVNDITH